MSSTMNERNYDGSVDHVAIDPPTSSPSSQNTRFDEKMDHWDDQLLKRAVADAGKWAFGSVMAEVWVMNEDRTKLYRPKFGWWIDPIVHSKQCPGCNLCRLTDPDHPNYLEPKPISPGVGLAGILWNESPLENNKILHRNSIESRWNNLGSSLNARKVAWRDIEYLASDPDQPANRRLKGLVEAGLAWGAGISFDIGGKQGIVLFLARKNVDVNKLRTKTNEAYLISASDLIGSAWSLRHPRQMAIKDRDKRLKEALQRARLKLLALIHCGVALENLADAHAMDDFNHNKKQHSDQEQPSYVYTPTKFTYSNQNIKEEDEPHPSRFRQTLSYMTKKLSTVAKKSLKGGMNQPPPPKPTSEALFSATGAFITFLMIAQLNIHMIGEYGTDYQLILPPLAALSTLNYALTAAPASQPRNCVLAQCVAIPIAVMMSWCSGIDTFLRQGISLFLTILLTTRLGIIHPPAGATSVIFSTGSAAWTEMAAFLIGYVVTISASGK